MEPPPTTCHRVPLTLLCHMEQPCRPCDCDPPSHLTLSPACAEPSPSRVSHPVLPLCVIESPPLVCHREPPPPRATLRPLPAATWLSRPRVFGPAPPTCPTTLAVAPFSGALLDPSAPHVPPPALAPPVRLARASAPRPGACPPRVAVWWPSCSFNSGTLWPPTSR